MGADKHSLLVNLILPLKIMFFRSNNIDVMWIYYLKWEESDSYLLAISYVTYMQLFFSIISWMINIGFICSTLNKKGIKVLQWILSLVLFTQKKKKYSLQMLLASTTTMFEINPHLP